jgi:hypothetical protein
MANILERYSNFAGARRQPRRGSGFGSGTPSYSLGGAPRTPLICGEERRISDDFAVLGVIAGLALATAIMVVVRGTYPPL